MKTAHEKATEKYNHDLKKAIKKVAIISFSCLKTFLPAKPHKIEAVQVPPVLEKLSFYLFLNDKKLGVIIFSTKKNIKRLTSYEIILV